MTRQSTDFGKIDSRLLRNFSPTDRSLIGVSGGRDSVALLYWLVQNGYQNVLVCHLDHQLRGRSSAADARFVQKVAAKYDLEVEIGSADVRALARKKKMSIETAARVARYSFFAKVAKRRRCRQIFLGHHADDLVETFLINLFRGSGPLGLGAMREVSVRRVEDVDLTIVRPFLSVWRNEIDKYVRAHRLKFREDTSNRDLVPLRNRVRRRIIPYLEKTIGRNIRQTIWRAAVIASEEEAWIDQAANRADGENAELSAAKLRELPIALQRRTMLKWLRSRNVADVGFELVERVRELAAVPGRVAKTNLPGGRHARRRAGKIFME